MYRSFRAKNFRCFTDLHVQDLARVNLIAGLNNVGKTALLEALFIHCSFPDPYSALSADWFRGLNCGDGAKSAEAKAPWSSLFGGFATSSPVELLGEQDIGKRRSVRLRPVEDPVELAMTPAYLSREPGEAATGPALPIALAIDCEEDGRTEGTAYLGASKPSGYWSIGPRTAAVAPAVFLASRALPAATEDAARYGKMEVMDQQDVVLNALRVIEPRLRRLAVVVLGDTPVMHGDIGLGRLIPLPLMGEGMTRIFSLVVGLGNAPKGIVLVDEIENGLHHSVLQKVWRAIAEAARQFDVQIFATTHSFECIAAAHRAFDGQLGFDYDFRLHRLERVNGDIVAKTYDRETMQGALQLGVEVR